MWTLTLHLLLGLGLTPGTLDAAARPALALAYRPLLDPIPIDDVYLLLLLPLIVVIAIVYKTIKLPDLHMLPKQAAYLSVQILVFLILAAAALWLLTELM